jgi:hypothetical protein
MRVEATVSRSTAIGLEGRPLTRDEESRIVARTRDRQPGSRAPVRARRYAIANPMAEFMALFVLGMLGGISAVFVALFIL